MAYKQSPRSPLAKALKGNQHKLPQHLQDAIKAAPESPAKQTSKYGKKHDRLVKRSDKLIDKGMREELGRSSFTTEEWKSGIPSLAKGKKIQKADKLSKKAAKIRAEKNSPAKKGSCGKY